MSEFYDEDKTSPGKKGLGIKMINVLPHHPWTGSLSTLAENKTIQTFSPMNINGSHRKQTFAYKLRCVCY